MFDTEFRRRFFIKGLAVLASSWVARRAGVTEKDQALRVVAPWEYDSPDPAETGYILTCIGVGETLVGVRPDGRLVGLLAANWAVDPDHLTWRFNLRHAGFHDGTPVMADHVAATLDRVRAQAEGLSAIAVASVRAEGERTVVIRTMWRCCTDQGYGRSNPSPFGVRRCGRRSGVQVPACG